MTRRLVLAPLLLAAACSGATDPGPDTGSRRVVGVIDVGGGAPRPLAAPDTVAAGVPFPVTVTTYGSGSCTRPDGAEVEVRGLAAEVIPYDRELTGNVACTDDLHPYPREVTLRFTEPGQATVRALGRSLRGGFATREAPVVVRP